MTMTHPTLGENRLPNNPLLSEILALVSKQKTKAKKIQILKENESMHIKSVLIGAEGTSIKTIAFNATDNELGAYLLKKNNNTFNIAGKLSLNEWRGQKNVEFIIDDISVNKNMKN